MRKLGPVALVALLVISLLSGSAVAAKKKSKPQVVNGSIRSQLKFADTSTVPPTVDSCYSGAHRRVAIASQEQANGITGYHFDLDKKTVGKKFTLKPTGGQGEVDLDITFYTEFGTPEQATDTAYAPPNFSYEKRGPGGETGIVPKGMKKAIVCMYEGMDATFTYSAKTSK
jgi:hypothetical protein